MKDILVQIIVQYLPAVLAIIATSFVAYLSKVCGNVAKNSTKKDIATTTVRYIEQIYKDLHGEEKFNEAKKKMVELLNDKGIKISETELTMLIEEAVNEMNAAVTKTLVCEEIEKE